MKNILNTILFLFVSTVAFADFDCNVKWSGVFHDTFDPFYRSVTGATIPGKEIVLRIRTNKNDLTSVNIRLWDDLLKKESYISMHNGVRREGEYDYWEAIINTGDSPTILYYFFELNDFGNGLCTPDTDYYVDDDPHFYGGGQGMVVSDINLFNSFQITVYDPDFKTPDWMKKGVIYQIFPDRFRDGDPSNNKPAGTFYYGTYGGTIYRSNESKWNTIVCDPRGTYSPYCLHQYGDNFYGGDLRGIIDKLNEGYFESLGVTVLYLNPIFSSPSNHRYDTTSFFTIDKHLGTIDDFLELAGIAHGKGIKIILDGVFNHTSSDSVYFDFFERYDKKGACEDTESRFREWFYFPAIGHPAISSVPITCAGGVTYETWYGYESLPKLNSNNLEVRNYFWANGTDSVAPYWIHMGADGWRLDVAGDVDMGLVNDPNNDYWEGFRLAVKNISGKRDPVIIGEEWGDASAWLLGNEWDSAMNYRLRSATLGWLFTGCVGKGCVKGKIFSDNDSNDQNYSGPISYLSPSKFNSRLLSIWEDYPLEAFNAMMNLTGSHDTNRMRFLLKKINFNNDQIAVRRMMEWWIFLFSYPGAPTIYYGDEVGLTHDAVFANGKWEDDPYNRAPYPWDDTPGYYKADQKIIFYLIQKLAWIRNTLPPLQDGDVNHGLVVDDKKGVYGFSRNKDDQTVFVALNRSNMTQGVVFNAHGFKEGTVFRDYLNDVSYEVKDGLLTVQVRENWGGIFSHK